ncbi:hypothetical protein DFJ58DRAFT_735784 [Suillus subalutaceus]|uniref:uncharacterized protein n=1 Tax=Suillus subalutaceus TaxID=48586 RepID=UPI001B87A09F|nr:uncharacterized protein DFJ58DRAFT_735784 [Suillus subalutaceus]KAG1834618.1 hypothetical protein DFJ58DRAFT_735784 [Suillus subalutaceus]
MSAQQSNNALSVANKSLHSHLNRIKLFQSDGRVVVDQAHEFAKLVSQALQQQGRNASVVPPLLLSAAAEVRATMNIGQVPQWECVRVDDSHMESHPFFPKTQGLAAPALAPVPTPLPVPVPVPPPAPKVMLVPPIDSLPVEAAKPTADKGKQPVWGTWRAREDESGESGNVSRKKRRIVSKAIISDTEDDDGQPGGTIIVVKLDTAKKVKQVRFTSSPRSSPLRDVQADTKERIGRPTPKGKGKEKEKEWAVTIAEGDVYDSPCKRCSAQFECLAALGRKGQITKSCARCYEMKVKCDRPVPNKLPQMAELVQSSRPRSKAPLASTSKPQPRATRAASHARLPPPVVESEDTMDDEDVAVEADEDIAMSHAADTEQQTDVAAVTPSETVNRPAAMASAKDFPADHWQEVTDDTPILPPPPPPPPPPAPAAKPTTSSAELTIHDCVVSLAARVAAMEMADRNTLARVDAMEHNFNSCISSMRAEFSDVQLSFNATVDVVNGLANMVEKMRQERSVLNTSFPPPAIGPTGASTATDMGIRYLTGVFGPSVAPNADSVAVSQPSASRPFGRPDVQGRTFTSGQPSSESVQAGPSSAPPIQCDLSVSCPASTTSSLP